MSESIRKKVNPKIPLIIECTLEILRDQGDQGLSMRKVAARAGMSLGNLQYYFRNKDELLLGLADVYFERCSTDFRRSLAERGPEGRRATLEFMVEYGLDYATSETCQLFRELWGIAVRNERIRERMHGYYELYAASIEEVLAPFAQGPDSVAKAATLFIPFFDGYGLVSTPLPLDREAVSKMLLNIVESVLEGDGDQDL